MFAPFTRTSSTIGFHPHGDLTSLPDTFHIESPPTLGVEVEQPIFRRRTGDPVPLSDRFRQRMKASYRAGGHLELFPWQAGYVTPPQPGVAGVRRNLAG